MFNFVFDRRNDSRPYPNLAPMMDNPHESYSGMGDDYPFIVPCRIIYYCQDHEYPCNIFYMDESFPEDSWYPVGIGFFSFDIDYFELMSDQVKKLLRENKLKVLFYYHEGDNPYHEKIRLDELCHKNNLSTDCYRFVSGNTKADDIDGFVWFADHELFYWRNAVRWNKRIMPGCSYHERVRGHKFTALNRIHKWWRATIMTELRDHRLLQKSIWSYNNVDQNDRWEDNPIELCKFDGLEARVKHFVKNSPYRCDTFDAVQQNSHWTLAAEHYDDSYVHLVIETFYDAEQSGGAFLTEKSFKPIRHAQPFVIFGTMHSICTLNKLGYRTFDHVIDHSYDLQSNNTDRFKKTFDLISKMSQQNLHDLYISCKEDLLHNQLLFLNSKYDRLESLDQKLNND